MASSFSTDYRQSQQRQHQQHPHQTSASASLSDPGRRPEQWNSKEGSSWRAVVSGGNGGPGGNWTGFYGGTRGRVHAFGGRGVAGSGAGGGGAGRGLSVGAQFGAGTAGSSSVQAAGAYQHQYQEQHPLSLSGLRMEYPIPALRSARLRGWRRRQSGAAAAAAGGGGGGGGGGGAGNSSGGPGEEGSGCMGDRDGVGSTSGIRGDDSAGCTAGASIRSAASDAGSVRGEDDAIVSDGGKGARGVRVDGREGNTAPDRTENLAGYGSDASWMSARSSQRSSINSQAPGRGAPGGAGAAGSGIVTTRRGSRRRRVSKTRPYFLDFSQSGGEEERRSRNAEHSPKAGGVSHFRAEGGSGRGGASGTHRSGVSEEGWGRGYGGEGGTGGRFFRPWHSREDGGMSDGRSASASRFR